MRVGVGYDVHRLESGETLRLGGVHIPHEKGLAGHSDADVLLHAISDALLGAAALGDIGTYFPDDDPTWADADSEALLEQVVSAVREAGYEPHNVDATVVLERPKLQPHIPAMKKNVAAALGVSVEHVSIKATTNEGLGPVGAEAAGVAHAVCTIQSS